MKTAWDTFMEYLNGRAKTRVYSLFILWLLILHANLIFFSLFVDQQYVYEKYDLLKNEYISTYLVDLSSISFWVFELIKLALAAGMTYAMIFIFPDLITKKSYDREIRDEYDLKLRKLKKEQELTNEKAGIVKTELKIAETEHSLQDEQYKIEKNEEKQWDREFKDFSNSPLYPLFGELIESIFKRNGKVKDYDYNGRIEFEMDENLLAFLTSTEVVSFDQEKGVVSLTKKGNNFIKNYQLVG